MLQNVFGFLHLFYHGFSAMLQNVLQRFLLYFGAPRGIESIFKKNRESIFIASIGSPIL